MGVIDALDLSNGRGSDVKVSDVFCDRVSLAVYVWILNKVLFSSTSKVCETSFDLQSSPKILQMQW